MMTAWRLVASMLLGPGCHVTSREPLNPDRTMYLYSSCQRSRKNAHAG